MFVIICIRVYTVQYAYTYFALQLKKLCLDLENLTAIGTDGKEALSSAL